uniref:Glucosamine 6-phosphate N-acetyltransferase n=1 Tax=Ditylenchus dipsaci TaxID=166011 RepID=A0A915CLM3_9BILA
MQVDGTYKIMTLNYPLLVCGFSDADKRFFPTGAAISSHEGKWSYGQFTHAISRWDPVRLYEPKLLIADGAPPITSACREEFPSARIGMCWFHVRQNLENELPKAKIYEDSRDEVTEDVKLLARATCYKEFYAALMACLSVPQLLIKEFDVPNGYSLRWLEVDDFNKGFIELLSQLTSVGQISSEKYEERFQAMAQTNCYHVLVIEDLNAKKIIGSATLVLEYKFIHECGCRGRIEDVVVDSSARGKAFGKLLNSVLVKLAQHFEVYKLSLECKDGLITFYEQFGYKKDNGNNFLVQRFD